MVKRSPKLIELRIEQYRQIEESLSKVPNYPLDIKEVEHMYKEASDKEWTSFYEKHISNLVKIIDGKKKLLSLQKQKAKQDALEKIYTIAKTFPTIIYLPDTEREPLEKSPYETLRKTLEDITSIVRSKINAFGPYSNIKIRISAGKVQPIFITGTYLEEVRRLREWRELDRYLNSPLKLEL